MDPAEVDEIALWKSFEGMSDQISRGYLQCYFKLGVVEFVAHGGACAEVGSRRVKRRTRGEEAVRAKGESSGLLTDNPALSILLFNFCCSSHTFCLLE